jgi:riboflavin synthase
MFTGIIEAVGSVTAAEKRDGGLRLTVRVPQTLRGLAPGSSLAVNGVCLTVVATEGDTLEFDAVGATLARTLLGSAVPGTELNLERSLIAGGRMDGHWVTGHVDDAAEVTGMRRGEGAVFYDFRVPGHLAPHIAPRGSVAVDGVSLTVAEALGDRFTVSIVPYTLEQTIFKNYAVGTRVHVETDVLAKYVERALAASGRVHAEH